MNTALDHFRPVRLPALIELLGADVACTLRFADKDKPHDAGRTCELLLANRAPVPVSVRLFGVDRRARTRTFGELSVAPDGLGSSVFMLPSGAAACERVYVEVVGEGVRLCADARMIPHRRFPPMRSVAAAVGIVTVGAAALIAGFVFESPVITAFGVPRTAAPGTEITAMYATAGAASGSFSAKASSGAALATGTLSSGSGSFTIPVPGTAAGQSVNVSLDLRGPLGNAHRDVSFVVDETPVKPAARTGAPPAHAVSGPVPRIAYFTAHREQYDGDPSVLASYQASGSSGVLRVRDERGRIVGSGPFTHVGTTRIALPASVADQTLRAEVVVFGGGSRASAAVEVPSARSNDASVSALAGGADAVAHNDGGSQPTPTDPFVATQRVVAGQPFRVAIRHPLPGLRIALQTTEGTTIDEIAVPAGARAVTLTAPQSSMVEVYYLAGTFTQASSEETLVRSLRIFPR